MRYLSVAALAVLLLASGCSPTTHFGIRVDFDSYLPPEQRSVSFTVPALSGMDIYLLPGIQVDEPGAGPDEDMSLGALVSVPSPPPESALRMAILVRVRVTNESVVDPLLGTTINVVVAEETSADVHSEGEVIGQAVLASVPPGGNGALDFVAEVAEGDSGYSILSSGSVRVGVGIRIDPPTVAAVPVVLEIQEVQCDLAFRPFSFFRLLQ